MAGLGAVALCRPSAARVDGAAWRISYVGHASLLLQIAGLNILLDPVWSHARIAVSLGRAETGERSRHRLCRLCRRSMSFLVSHAHYDHLDVGDAVAACGRASPARHHAARQRRDHARSRYGDRGRGLRLARSPLRSAATSAVTLVPTRHWSARNLSDRNMSLWASFVIAAPAGRIYVVGDSGYGDGEHFRERARALRAVPARRSADRRLRAALVHARPAHEPGRVGEGIRRLRSRARDRPSLRHVPAHRRADRCAASSRWPMRCGSRKFRPSVSVRCARGRCFNSSNGTAAPAADEQPCALT